MLRYWFDAYWQTGVNNDAYLTNTFVRIHEYDFWTWGDSPEYAQSEIINIHQTLQCGYGGTGGMDITNGATLTTHHWELIGDEENGNGTVNLNGGVWNAEDSVYLGNQGTGLLNIRPGATMNMLDAGRMQVGPKGRLVLDGGVLNISKNISNGGTVELNAGQLNILDYVSGLNGAFSGNAHVTVESDGWWAVDDLALVGDMQLTLEGGVVQTRPAGVAMLGTGIEFVGGGTIHMGGQGAHLIHANQTLSLLGGRVMGSGFITTGPAGINLGAEAIHGGLFGDSDTERLVVYGDVTGSGIMANVTVHGNVSVGASPGQMTMDNVRLGSTSAVTMEIMGTLPGHYDHLILGTGTDFNACPIDIVLAGYAPQRHDTFGLFDALGDADLVSILSTATLNLPPLADGLHWNTGALYASGQITVIPEPAVMALLIVGGSAVLHHRPKRPNIAIHVRCRIIDFPPRANQ